MKLQAKKSTNCTKLQVFLDQTAQICGFIDANCIKQQV